MPKSFRQRQGGAPPRVARSWGRGGVVAHDGEVEGVGVAVVGLVCHGGG